MNNVDLVALEQKKIEALKKYKLDEESIKKFREEIERVSDEESNNLGKELFELIKSRGEESQERLDKIVKLIKKGANVEYKNEEKGDFALLHCARKNKLKSFIILVRAGANVNQSNNYQTTATMASARHGNKEILSLLILLGADVNAQCKDGDNALMSAKRHDQIECFDLLRQANAQFGVRNNLNQTVMDIPSTRDFDFSSFLRLDTTPDDPFKQGRDLLLEAENTLAELKRDNLQSNAKVMILK